MVRLTALSVEDMFFYTLSRDGAEPFISRDAGEIAEGMQRIGVDEPLPLIAAARQRGAIEVLPTPERR